MELMSGPVSVRLTTHSLPICSHIVRRVTDLTEGASKQEWIRHNVTVEVIPRERTTIESVTS